MAFAAVATMPPHGTGLLIEHIAGQSGGCRLALDGKVGRGRDRTLYRRRGVIGKGEGRGKDTGGVQITADLTLDRAGAHARHDMRRQMIGHRVDRKRRRGGLGRAHGMAAGGIGVLSEAAADQSAEDEDTTENGSTRH